MKRYFLLIALMLLPFYNGCHAQVTTLDDEPQAAAYHIEPQSFYYNDLVQSITYGLSSDYDKARAIYIWICKNILFDSTTQIHRAEECYNERRGSAMALCELFEQMAQVAGIKAEIVVGKVRNHDSDKEAERHAWICATLDKGKILLDPTWGATMVNNGNAHKSYAIEWFDVDPQLMIFSHLPDDNSLQLLDRRLSYEEFIRLPKLLGEAACYNLDIGAIYSAAIEGEVELPELFYSRGANLIELSTIPLEKRLHIGHSYTFRIKLLDKSLDVALINDQEETPLAEWQSEGDGIYSIDYMPRTMGEVHLVCSTPSDKKWSVMAKYELCEPKAEEWAMLAERHPLHHPDIRDTKNLNKLYIKEWHDAGVDDHRLASLIREHNTDTLPIIYNGFGRCFKIVEMPMNYTLYRGERYTFKIYPENDAKWAVVIVQGLDWSSATAFRDWQVEDDGMLSMTIKANRCGQLLLMYNTGGDNFISCMGYMVVDK